MQGSGNISVGMIIPFYGNINDIPKNFHLCDGTNGTPDLRDKFIIGAGNEYALGDAGGAASHTLSISELPDLASYLNQNLLIKGSNEMNGSENLVSTAFFNAEYNWKNEGNLYGWFRNAFQIASGSVTNQAFDIRPPYYSLYWIMRIK